MPLPQVTEFAYAKVNLTLHVTGQRADGYHLLDSLVAFAGVGDVVHCQSAPTLGLTIVGPQAASLPPNDDNLVLRAARHLAPLQGAALTLEKHLPVASGIGGGSADAAATLRALSRLWKVTLPASVLALGADVPACMTTAPKRMQGIGEILSPVASLPECHLVLINPGQAVSTQDVFRALKYKTNAAMAEIPAFETAVEFAAWLMEQRNDLQTPAIASVPAIETVIAALAAQRGCLIARMSGSGATCFGVFAKQSDAEGAANILEARHPDWWVRAAPVLS